MMKTSKKELLENLKIVLDLDGDRIAALLCKEDFVKELHYLSEVLGGYDDFQSWSDTDVYNYLIGVWDGLYVLDNYHIDWEDDYEI